MSNNTLQFIYKQKLVAVIRGIEGSEVLSVAQALKEGGINVLEVAADTPGILSIIEALNEAFGDEMIVGAGTVLDAETARATILAGAKFIFSPTVNSRTIKMTKRYDVVSIPGALTPTEILKAYEAGADIIKVFPANIMGPKYIKDIHAPLPHIPLMPTGGVDLNNINEYFKNGAVAAGLGSALVNARKLMNPSALKDLKTKALQFRGKVSL
ncbi:2-dehydro-3-deoxy-phosphogluconate aldolase [Pullulanibacillus camelliae]|uniref:2-dehydro-3-deoxy-phosphogluconate aldolase n=1 Tax=Pullulanibacillus camelliae TaxID=1707096 RepID=A0A8J2YF25_9BACL|nr:bifunctional 4-hydroxy-2-oxoglutarate aldolase/2-dehydro-3-deoxy-phosphogluconate aldolase [Pullulanibacillus camelliae]GGE30351.1 2-dehydro-3-deoxy-phosphogluconate aldolase [Pullulanibacillus camelliae]